MTKHIASAGQTCFDLSLLYCGKIDAAFSIALGNGISLTHVFESGDEVAIPAFKNINNTVVLHLAQYNPAMSSGGMPAQEEVKQFLETSGTIGTAVIGLSFVISQ